MENASGAMGGRTRSNRVGRWDDGGTMDGAMSLGQSVVIPQTCVYFCLTFVNLKEHHLGWDNIPEIRVQIVFHRESTIEISPRPIYPRISGPEFVNIHNNGKVCAKKTRFPPFFGTDLAQTFPARYHPDRPGGPGSGEFPAPGKWSG
jgi:hypothetical protein